MLRLAGSIWALFDACVDLMVASAPAMELSAQRIPLRSSIILGLALLLPATAQAMPTAPSAVSELPIEQVVLVGAVAEAAVGAVAHAISSRSRSIQADHRLADALEVRIQFGKYSGKTVKDLVMDSKTLLNRAETKSDPTLKGLWSKTDTPYIR